MSRVSLSYIVQSFYFPLGAVTILLLFSQLVLSSAQEKEKKLALLSQEVAFVRQSLQDAATSVEQNSMVTVPAKLGQISSSLQKIETSLQPEDLGSRVETEWMAVQHNWKELKAGTLSGEASSLTDPQKQQLGTSLGALQLRCDTLHETLRKGVESSIWLAWLSMGALFLLLCCLLGYICYFVHSRLLKPMGQLLEQLQDLRTGKLDALTVEEGFFEPLQQQLAEQQALQTYLAMAVGQIGDGQFQQEEDTLQQAGVLGKAVLQVRHKMQLYFQADQRRAWSSQGIEKFNKLLRAQLGGIDGLCKELISELVPFLNASQGAVFTVEQEQDEEVLQLKASYAWGRHKYLNKSVQFGEGLIGQVAKEKDTLLITDVPADYITIGSGLGRAKPRCILILPLMANEQLQGVLELASFRVFEPFEQEFLEKIAENVASSLASLKTASETQGLLDKANAANVHLQAQEEELRQNTEELIATQEAMLKKEMELTGLFTSINYSLFTAEFELDGSLLSANDNFIDFGRVPKGEVHCFKLLQVPQWKAADELSFWQDLTAGRPRNIECCLRSRSESWVAASFTPVLDTAGRVQKIMMLATDISQRKEAEIAYIAQTEEITRQEEKLRHYTAELEVLQASLSDKLKQAQQEMQHQIREIALEKEKNMAILEGCVDGVVSFNEKGIIEYFNKAAEEIWENTRLEVLGARIGGLMSIEIQWENEEPQVYFSKGGNLKMLDVRTEVPLFGANGEEIEALLTLTRVKVGKHYVFTAFVQKVAVELF